MGFLRELGGTILFVYYLCFALFYFILFFSFAHSHPPALDFAGGTVVHMSSGFSALVAAIVVGRRQDVDNNKPHTPHNVPFVLLGAAILVC
jgi:ammonia channel protein AmtB